MGIVLKENDWAEYMIESHSLGENKFETLRRIARYYIDTGYDKNNVYKYLNLHIIRSIPDASLSAYDNIVELAIKKAYKREAINIDYISVSRNEFNTIRKIEGKQLQRLAFTLLCIAKYWHKVNPVLDYWVFNEDSEIMKIANINTSIKRQCMMYFKLRELNLLKFAKRVDNTNTKVLFVDDNDEYIKIYDFRNLGYQYHMFCGDDKNYIRCECCGRITKINNDSNKGRQKYCKECSQKIQAKKDITPILEYVSKIAI